MLVLAVAGVVVGAGPVPAGDKGNVLIVVDANGKEHQVKDWKFTKGTRHLSWLAPDAPEDKGKGKNQLPAGPEALEFVEGKGAPLKKGVLTYVPLASIRSITFDAGKDKETVTVRVVRSDKEADDEVLVGPTGYVGINQLTISAVADLGDLGQAAVEFHGGVDRGLRSVRFPAPKPIEPVPEGRQAVIKAASKGRPTLEVVGLQPLYARAGGHFVTLPTLYFKDTVKVDMGKIAALTQVGSAGTNFDVTLTSGQQHPLVLIERPKGPDGKGDLQLQGLVGRFGGGWRLFPMAAVGEVQLQEKKV
jgi:hypothetical protein